MKYIVLDLEWNQPRYRGEIVRKPVFLSGEIVQIGAVRLNRFFRIKKELRMTVSPRYYKKMHKKVSRITGLKNEDVKKGIPFEKAVQKLRRFCGKNYVFLVWGNDDVAMLRDNLKAFGLPEDWVARSFDLQVIFSHQILKEKRQIALECAIEMLGEKPFQAHDALFDAHSTALICRHLDMKQGLDDYPQLYGDICEAALEKTEIGVTFPDKSAAMRELGSAPFFCDACGEYLEPGALIGQNARKYLARATAESGKAYLVRFAFFRRADKRVRATREVFPLTKELDAWYQKKEEEYRIKAAAARQKEKKKRRRRKAAAKENAVALS